MKTKLKKLFRTWGIIALAFLMFFYFGKDHSDAFYELFIFAFVVSGIFILFGWDKYITYGDEPVCNSKRGDDDAMDDHVG